MDQTSPGRSTDSPTHTNVGSAWQGRKTLPSASRGEAQDMTDTALHVTQIFIPVCPNCNNLAPKCECGLHVYPQ